MPIWTPDALRSESGPAGGACWRLVEAQHRVSTMKLVDTLDEQALLEEELERTKPTLPPECRRLHILLATPFRYGRYPGNSRFRRAGMTPGVFYGSEQIETAVAEIAFYRLLFFLESPATPLPRNPLEFTAFQSDWRVERRLDLTAAPFRDEAGLTHPTDYSACLDLADAAREAGISAIRYRSVRDPRQRANVALLDCTVFTRPNPRNMRTWRLAMTPAGINAICDWPGDRLALPLSGFADDPRIAAAIARA